MRKGLSTLDICAAFKILNTTTRGSFNIETLSCALWLPTMVMKQMDGVPGRSRREKSKGKSERLLVYANGRLWSLAGGVIIT
jgi:hypothetical protein